jgi:glycosyltransferase involved in cell wall biosynthesis
MKQRLKILSVIDIPWNSGLAAYAFDQALALRSAGHAVVFACPAGSAAMAFAAASGFKAYEIPGRKEHHKVPLALLRLRAVARDEEVTVAAAHTGRAQTLAFLIGLPLVRVKADAKRPSAGFTFGSVKKVIAASSYIENLYLASGLDRSKLAVIRQGIGLPPEAALRAAPPYRVGLLGRLDLVKGHDCFLRAAAELLRSGAAAEFHVAGYEANLKYSELRRTAADLGIAEKVFFHGRTEGPFGFMAACDVGVLPSLGSEAVSRAALEWLAAGRPLIASAVGSLPEYIPAERLVSPGDPAALAAALAPLLANPDLLARLGGENRARAARDFSREEFAAATVKVFEEAAL